MISTNLLLNMFSKIFGRKKVEKKSSSIITPPTGPESPKNVSPKVESTNGAAKLSTWVPLIETPALTRRKLRVVCVGAGYSGLTLAHKIQHEYKLEDVLDLQIYDKNADVGGTWFENTYPGAACDIPSRK